MKSGFVFVDKEANCTSMYIDRSVKKKFDEKVVGHLGTLDPFATGLLIVAIGEACKFLSILPDGEKTYIASLKLGIETASDDLTGEVIQKKAVPDLDEDQISVVLNSFLGKSMQRPNAFSARRINGVRAYQLAREGEEVVLPEKEIEVYSIELLSYDKEQNVLSFKTRVSKGTYIRSLGRDIAIGLNTVGHLISLRRTEIGAFDLSRAKKIEDINAEDKIEILDVMKDFPSYEVSGKLAYLALHGQKLKLNSSEETLIVKENGKLYGIYKKDGDIYRCYRGIRDEN